jgi:hypothetical protein
MVFLRFLFHFVGIIPYYSEKLQCGGSSVRIDGHCSVFSRSWIWERASSNSPSCDLQLQCRKWSMGLVKVLAGTTAQLYVLEAFHY